VGRVVAVEADGVAFFVELAEGGGDDLGVGVAGLEDRFDFGGVRDTIGAVAGQLASVWERVQPSEATVAFGLKVTGKSGRLTGLLVEGGGEASLTVTMKWTGLSKEEPVEAAGEG
jgi:hypothetical protein